MVQFDQLKIDSWMKSALSEKIFYLLHEEMNCLVFPSGHEYLYPNLVKIASISKKKYHDNIKSQEAEIISQKLNINKDFVERSLGEERFKTNVQRLFVSSSPDFTVVTYSGNILQFEVKYRKTGKLSQEDIDQFIVKYPNAYIFLISRESPYIQILTREKDFESQKKYEEKSKEELSKPLILTREERVLLDAFRISEAKVRNLLREGKIKSDEFDTYFQINLNWTMKDEKIQFNNYEKKINNLRFLREQMNLNFYKLEPLQRQKDGSIVIQSSLFSEHVMYPSYLLTKYENIILKWLK